MKLEIKNIEHKDIDVASKLLTKSFASDKGVIVLFEEKDPKYGHKVNQWFKATLKMLIDNNQVINGVFEGDELVGVSILTHTSYKPSFLSLLEWTFSILWNCGMKTVKLSARHDNSRKNTFTNESQFILEFVAVNQKHRGKGIGRMLFEHLNVLADSKNVSVWLETTKDINIEIFNKMGFTLKDTKIESSVKYYIMTNEQNHQSNNPT